MLFHYWRFGKIKSIALIFFTLHSIFAEIFGFKLIWEALNKYFHAFYSSFQSVDHNFCACTSWKAAKTILYLKRCSYGRSILRISWKLRCNIRSKSWWRLFSNVLNALDDVFVLLVNCMPLEFVNLVYPFTWKDWYVDSTMDFRCRFEKIVNAHVKYTSKRM